MNHTLPLCPACRSGHLHPATRVRTFHPHGGTVAVELLTSRCDRCAVDTTRASQHDENLVRLAARKAQYGKALLGEEMSSCHCGPQAARTSSAPRSRR